MFEVVWTDSGDNKSYLVAKCDSLEKAKEVVRSEINDAGTYSVADKYCIVDNNGNIWYMDERYEFIQTQQVQT